MSYLIQVLGPELILVSREMTAIIHSYGWLPLLSASPRLPSRPQSIITLFVTASAKCH